MTTKVKLIAPGVITPSELTLTTASGGTNTTAPATTAFVQQEISSLVDSSPGALNTLNELAAALGDDANFSTTVTNSIATKLPLAGGTITGTTIITGTAGRGLVLSNATESYTNNVAVINAQHSQGILQFKTANTERMRIDKDGNVGIGTDAPDAKLSVTSTTINSEDILYLKSGADNVNDYLGIAWELGVGGNGPHSAIRSFAGPSGSDARLGFLTTSNGGTTLTEGLSVAHNGNVGIGTTTPAQKFHVAAGYIHVDAGYGITWDNTHERIEQSDGHLEFFVNNGEAMTLETNGLGIGTTSPSRRLHIGGTAPGHSIIRQDATSSGTNWEIGERVAGKYQFWEDDGDKVIMTLMSAGNVGVGTASPSERLHVDGVIASQNSGQGAGQLQLQGYGNSAYINHNGSGALIFRMGSGFSERFRIATDGTLTSYVNGGMANLALNNEADTPYMSFMESAAAKFYIGESSVVGGGGGYDLYAAAGKGITFFTNASRRVDIDTSGNLLIGTTSTSIATTSSETGTQISDGGISIAANNPVAQFNRISSDGAIVNFRKNGSTVGSIGVLADRIYFAGANEAVGIDDSWNAFVPLSTGGGNSDNDTDLGNPSSRFKDLYLSGTISSGRITATGGNGDQLALNNAGERFTQIGLQHSGTQNGALWLDDTDSMVDLYANTSHGIRLKTGGDNPRVTILSGGNVGIGTNTPDHPLEVVGVISSADTGLQKSTFENAGNDLVITANKGQTNVASNIIFKSSQSGGTSTERMRISNLGNVGINTSNPYGGTGVTSMTVNAASYPVVSLKRADGHIFQIFGYYNHTTLNTSVGWMQFDTGGAERMRIDNLGNVGIGATGRLMSGYDGNSKTLTVYDSDGSAQSGYLELASLANNNGYNAGAITFINNANSNNSAPENANSKTVAQIRAETVTSDNNAGDDAGSDLVIFTKPEAGGLAERMRISSDGYVSLNRGANEYGLELKSAGTRSGLVLKKPGTDTIQGSLLMLADESLRLGTASVYNIQMYQNGNVTMPSGNVGIGVSDPATPLHVKKAGDGTLVRLGSSGVCDWDLSIGNSSTLSGVGSGALELLPQNANSANEFAIGQAGTTTRLFHLTNSQNYFKNKVGIGTSSPTAKLHVYDAGGNEPSFRVQRGLDGGRIQFVYASNTTTGLGEIGQTYYGTGRTRIWMGANLESFSTGHSSPAQQDSSYGSWFSTWDSYHDEFTVNRIASGTTTEMLTLNYLGRLGVGASNPTQKLEVAGGIKFSYVSAGDGLNVVSYQTFNNSNTYNSCGSVYYTMFVINFYHNNGHSQCFFVANGGGGVGYNFTGIVPGNTSLITGTGINTSFTTIGSSPNSFTINISSGGGALSVSRTSGTGSFGISVHKLAGG